MFGATMSSEHEPTFRACPDRGLLLSIFCGFPMNKLNSYFSVAILCLSWCFASTNLNAQQPPYDIFPDAQPPYFRIRYALGDNHDGLAYAVNYTLWVPDGLKKLRGVIVHQHGCGEGSCKSGLTGAFDLHWQALAKKHSCALLGPSYEQPEGADCQLWCDPRNGSDKAFQQSLSDLGALSGHPELSQVPWALWGHSGGGHWAGGMALLHPEKVAAAWLRSGVPLLTPDPSRPGIQSHQLNDAVLQVPIMCNLGTKEGVSVTDGRFSSVWPANQTFFKAIRQRGGLIGVAIDPMTAHECGNQRYLAIPWIDACLTERLPSDDTSQLRSMPSSIGWLGEVGGTSVRPIAEYSGDQLTQAWLPNEAIANKWLQYVRDTQVSDDTPPSAPYNIEINGNQLRWEAEADLESGLAGFLIERDGQIIAKLPESPQNPFGRHIFQNLQYSDTPTQPLVTMTYTDSTASSNTNHQYRVYSLNTVGLQSQ